MLDLIEEMDGTLSDPVCGHELSHWGEGQEPECASGEAETRGRFGPLNAMRES